MFGLKDRDIKNIQKALGQFPNIKRAIIFGSRAMGNYKQASDIDLAIDLGMRNDDTLVRLSGILNEELPIPFFIDVIDIAAIKNQALLEHIKKAGKELPLKKKNGGVTLKKINERTVSWLKNLK